MLDINTSIIITATLNTHPNNKRERRGKRKRKTNVENQCRRHFRLSLGAAGIHVSTGVMEKYQKYGGKIQCILSLVLFVLIKPNQFNPYNK
jgi:hypothetical protein